MILTITFIPFGLTATPDNLVEADNGDCIQYEASTKTILINCKSANLTDLYTSVDNPKILDKDQPKYGFLMQMSG